jgi:hypothetical protein
VENCGPTRKSLKSVVSCNFERLNLPRNVPRADYGQIGNCPFGPKHLHVAPMADPPRTIAQGLADYGALLRAVRDRVAELGITHETVDAVSGLQSGYTSKLLADPPIRRMGPIILFLVLQSLGMTVSLIDDPIGLSSLRHRLTPRKVARRFDHRAGSITIDRDHFRRIGRMGAAARWHNGDGGEVAPPSK